MMDRKRPIVFMVACAILLSSSASVSAGRLKPVTNNGQKWRIGYLEGGPYSNYQSILKEIILNLMDSGWIESQSLPESENESETQTLWQFLAQDVQSQYLQFSSNRYWSINWDSKIRKRLIPMIIERLNKKKDIDLMLAFGTWAGQDLANDRHQTPTMVVSASNAIQSGIIKSVEDSGFKHLHAFIDPDKTERQLRLFHEIIGFKRMGIAYEDDTDGRSYAGIDDVIKLSEELNFEVIECRIPLDTEKDRESQELINCHESLSSRIDSMYITDYAGLTRKSIEPLLAPFFKHKIPTFAQTRYDLVENGILIGAGRSDFTADAQFYSQTLVQILHGASPGDLTQKFESPLDIVVNLECAKRIGFRIPLDVLAGAFEVHDTIPAADKSD